MLFIKQHWRINLIVKLTMSRDSTDENFLYMRLADEKLGTRLQDGRANS